MIQMILNITKERFKSNILDNFILMLPLIIVLIIFGGAILAFILGRPDFFIRSLVVAVPGIFAAIFLHYIYKNLNEECKHDYSLIDLNERKCIKVFFIFYLLSIINLWFFPIRPVYYLVIITILYITIFIHIFTKNTNPAIVLFEIYLILINLIYSVTLKYPLYFGGTDIMPHIFAAKVTFLSGHTIPADLSIGYANFPLFHILISEVSLLLGFSIQQSYFIIMAPIFATTTFFIYLLMLNLSNDKRASLLSSLLYSTLTVVIYSGMYMVTRTMAFVGFTVLLYLMYKQQRENILTVKLICLLFALFIILVHQVSTPQILGVICLIFFVETVVHLINPKQKKYMSKIYILLLLVSFISYWLYTSHAFVESLSTIYFDSTNYEALAIKGTVQAGNEWSFIFNSIDYSVITFLALIGIGGTLYFHKRNYLLVFSLVSLLILPLYVPSPLQLLWNTMTLFRFDRFMLLVSPFIASMMALSIIYLNRFFQYKVGNKVYFFMITIFLISLLLTFSLRSTSPESNYGVSSERRYFNSGEIVGFNHVINHVPYGSELYSDYFTRRYFPYQKFSETDSLRLSYYNGGPRTSLSTRNLQKDSGYIIWRNKAFLESGLRLGDGENVDMHPNDSLKWKAFDSELQKKNKIYSNYDVDIFN